MERDALLRELELTTAHRAASVREAVVVALAGYLLRRSASSCTWKLMDGSRAPADTESCANFFK